MTTSLDERYRVIGILARLCSDLQPFNQPDLSGNELITWQVERMQSACDEILKQDRNDTVL